MSKFPVHGWQEVTYRKHVLAVPGQLISPLLGSHYLLCMSACHPISASGKHKEIFLLGFEFSFLYT
jgi:hypothetical protein